MNTTAMRTLSDNARDINTRARAYVYAVDRKQYDGLMPQETASKIYQSRAHQLVVELMDEELAPYRMVAVQRAMLSMKVPADDTDPDLKAAMDTIAAKWRAVFEELVPNAGVTGAELAERPVERIVGGRVQ